MINTHAKFYYGWEITLNNRFLDYQFSSDLTPSVATLKVGKYSTDQLMAEVVRAFKDAGAPAVTMSFNRTTRQFTINSGYAFSILSSTGVNVALGGAWITLGFVDASDKVGSMGYTAENSTGIVWTPQFKLQSLTTPGQNWDLRNPVMSETASGDVELAHSGKIQMISFEAVFITNVQQPNELVIRNSKTAVQDVLAFMAFATMKGVVEFMPDENNPNLYYPLILENSGSGSNGVAFKLIEIYDQNLPKYHRTGVLEWRIYGN